MVNPFKNKEILLSLLLFLIITLSLFFFSGPIAMAFLLGALAFFLPNTINLCIGWGYNKNQRIVKGMALNLFFAMFLKYLIVISIFALTLGVLKYPLVPLLAGYFLALIFHVFYALTVK